MNNYYAPYNILIDFVDVPSVINSLNLEVANVTSQDIIARCVVPTHNDSSPSMHINKEYGYWHCFGCREKGSLLKMVEYVTGLEFPASLDYIREHAPELSYDDILNAIDANLKVGIDKQTSTRVKTSISMYSGNTVKLINDKPVYLPMGTQVWGLEVREWCITKGIIADSVQPYFELGYCRLGQYRNRIIIPVMCNNKMVDFQARDFMGYSTPKDLYIAGIPIGNFLFNYDIINWDQPVGVVEGAVDVLRLWPYYWNTVGVMGSSISDPQAELLQKAKEIIIMPDPDEGGFVLLNSIKAKLEGKPMRLRYFDKSNISNIVPQAKRIN